MAAEWIGSDHLLRLRRETIEAAPQINPRNDLRVHRSGLLLELQKEAPQEANIAAKAALRYTWQGGRLRLKPSSTRHRKRYSASTSSVENSAAFSEVTRMNQSAAASVFCDNW